MHLILLAASPALADRVLWTAEPSDADRAAAAELVPGARQDLLSTVGAAPRTDPSAALATLDHELTECRTLFRAFDGELQVMARLQKATADVRSVRTPQEAELVWRALVLQGVAVHRYFQDKVATDPLAAPYRDTNGRIAAWADAAALAGALDPIAEDTPEPGDALAYDAVRASVQAAPAGSVVLTPVPPGAVAVIDGLTATKADAPLLLTAGRHFLTVSAGGEVLLATDVRLQSGETRTLTLPPGPDQRAALLAGAKAGATLAEPWPALLATEPTWLGTPGQSTFWRVDGGSYQPVSTAKVAAAPPPPSPTRVGYTVHVGAGAGWLESGNFFLDNVDEGAPHDVSTVNSVAFVGQVGGEVQAGLFAAGLGVDLDYATGDWHYVNSGNSALRSFTWAHADVGLKWVQVGVGPLFPWYLGVGAQAQVPVIGRLQVVGGGVYGVPLTIDRGDDPAFTPEPAYTAWAGVGYRLH